MHQAEIARVFEADGPFTSVYLDTEGDVEQAADRVALRWKNLRGSMLAAGVPEGTAVAIDPLVEGSHMAGGTLAVIAAVDRPLYVANLPDPPPRDTLLRHGALPDVVPLLAAAQAAVPHVAVLTDRTGADMVARGVADEAARAERVEGRVTPHLHKPQAGGWSQPRFHHRAEAIWESNASEVADALARLVDQVRPRFVAAAGDVRALQLLREQAPKRVRELLTVVGGEYGSLEAVFAAADKLAAATVEADNRALLDRFAEELGQAATGAEGGAQAVEGAAATLAALARGQVATLLLTGLFLDDRRTAWFGPAPTDVAADRDALVGLGVPGPVEGRLVDVAVRAALGTGAEVRVLDPADETRSAEGRGATHDAPAPPDHAPGEGLGALLRFPLGP
ncbi:MAG TPA: Vms1/Ankzf1 family peptidyl-tRNA hydrolase [Actinomycetota bacterium]|nr:Vms1/Ankzf1 family peptidyl-tRNA hydrolase [Actinomycetota bacterium]